MATESKLNPGRRHFLGLGAGAAGVLATTSPLAKALAASCGLTPPQTPGPFYPGESQFSNDADLTVVPGSVTRAVGQVIYIRGKVLDQHCKPLPRTSVEIWQACASGKYNHPNDPNSAPLDRNFKYWAEVSTDETGEYGFKTILPGAYPADATWTRPPHIHFKVAKLGFQELVTQMYFKGQPDNDADLILRQVPIAERKSVVIDFRPAPVGYEAGALIGQFDITLQRLRG